MKVLLQITWWDDAQDPPRLNSEALEITGERGTVAATVLAEELSRGEHVTYRLKLLQP
jgi:hypothetical protein